MNKKILLILLATCAIECQGVLHSMEEELPETVFDEEDDPKLQLHEAVAFGYFLKVQELIKHNQFTHELIQEQITKAILSYRCNRHKPNGEKFRLTIIALGGQVPA